MKRTVLFGGVLTLVGVLVLIWSLRGAGRRQVPEQVMGPMWTAVGFSEAVDAKLDSHGDVLPRGAFARLGTRYLRHSGVRKLQWSSDGRTLVSAGCDGAIRCWDTVRKKQVGLLQCAEQGPAWFALSPDDNLIAATLSQLGAKARGSISLLEYPSGRLVRELAGHPFEVTSLAFSADGRYLASASKDGTARVWEVASGKEERRFEWHGDVIREMRLTRPPDNWELRDGRSEITGRSFVVFSPDGNRLATFGQDYRGREEAYCVKVWDVGRGRLLHRLLPLGLSYGAVFSPNGELLIDSTGQCWKVEDGSLVRTFSNHGELLAGSTDGTLLATAGYGSSHEDEDTKVFVHEVATGGLLRVIEASVHGVTALAFAPTTHVLATAADGCTIRIWDARTGTPLVDEPEAHSAGLGPLAFSANGKHLASGGIDDVIRIWDVPSKRQLRVLKGHTSLVQSIAFAPDGSRLVSGSYDNTARLWDVATGQDLASYGRYNSRVNPVVYSPCGRFLAIDVLTEKVIIVDAIERKELVTIAHGYSDYPAGFSRDGNLVAIAATNNSTIRLFETKTGRPVGGVVDANKLGLSLNRFSPDVSVGTLGVMEGPISLVSGTPEGQILAAIAAERKPDCVAFSPDGRLVAFGTQKTIVIGDLKTGRVVDEFETDQHHVRFLTFSPDSAVLASSSYDSTILLWDVSNVLAQAGN